MPRISFHPGTVLTLLFLTVFSAATVYGWQWPFIAKLMPVYFVALPGIIICIVQLYRGLIGREEWKTSTHSGIEVDEVFRGGLGIRAEIGRTLAFFGWFGGGAVGVWLLGVAMALPLLVLAYALVEGREKWWVSLVLAGGTFLFLQGLFEYVLNIPWPPGVLFR